MAADWGRVTLEHVRQACELYDSGAAVPKRTAHSTFLVCNGRSYPAKFIRGLAYRLATGVELDPNRDYSGGSETVRFFEGLGLSTQHGQPAAPAESTASPVVSPSPAAAVLVEEPANSPREHKEPQKRALAELLRRRFGVIETEAGFPWLTVPGPGEMDATTRAIFDALQAMRGYSAFATPGRALRCDFFIPSDKLIVEYDERQHFTLQRARALELYPADLSLGFDRDEWITACRTVQATDPLPPYRDEQRAFYDSLRDILAARNGVRLVRLRYGSQDWAAPGADEALTAVLAGASALRVRDASGPTGERICKIALVAHDYNVADSGGRYDYSEHFARINRLCDEQGCDTILYALYTWDDRSRVPRTHDALFEGLAHVRYLILEVGEPPDRYDHVEVWQRGAEAPLVARQRFATSSAPGYQKQAFLDDLPRRQIQDTLLVLCGETNIASLVRGSGDFYDPYHFADRLRDMNIRLIFNPVHDYMRRYEMREKRRYYSRGGRTVVSVWNQGKGQESYLPWTVFHDGVEHTAAVRELPRPFAERPDIRIGILDLAAVGAASGSS